MKFLHFENTWKVVTSNFGVNGMSEKRMSLKKKTKVQKKRLGPISSIIYVFKVIMFLATQIILNKNTLKRI
jgi:hypothetical protein